MIDAWMARVREPRFGIVFFSAVIAFLMSAHWTPMAVPGAVAIVLAVLRPHVVARPLVWWVMAGFWFLALVVAEDRMEDHVFLFAVWLVALAICLRQDDDDGFLRLAAWQARVLVGVTFTVAVGWKLWFDEYVSGMTLWAFIVLDDRMALLGTSLGFSGGVIAEDRQGIRDVLFATSGQTTYQAPADLMWRVTVVAVLTLLLEATIGLSHLVGDSSRLAALRLPSIVLFGVATYSVVPVLPFATLLGTLAIVSAGWRREVMWVLPVMVLPSLVRLVTLVV